MALVGAFALFHGYAHGSEMADGNSGHVYVIGFVCATAILHALGVGLGLAMAPWRGAIGAVSNSWAAAPSRLPEWRSYHHLSDTESKPQHRAGRLRRS